MSCTLLQYKCTEGWERFEANLNYFELVDSASHVFRNEKLGFNIKQPVVGRALGRIRNVTNREANSRKMLGCLWKIHLGKPVEPPSLRNICEPHEKLLIKFDESGLNFQGSNPCYKEICQKSFCEMTRVLFKDQWLLDRHSLEKKCSDFGRSYDTLR